MKIWRSRYFWEGVREGCLYGMAVALLVLGLLSLTGCDPCARLARRCPPAATVRDSVWVHDSVRVERWRVDTVVRVKLERETVREAVPLADTARAETAYARALSYADGTRLVLRLENKDSEEMLVQRINTLESRLKEAYSARSEVKVQTVYKCRTIVKAGAWIGLAAVLSLLGYLAARIASIVKRE